MICKMADHANADADQANAEPLPSRPNGNALEHYVIREHMGVDEVKRRHRNQYTNKPVAAPEDVENDEYTVPHYPRPVEFHSSRVAHVTTKEGMNGILDSGGFKRSERTNVLWWSLVIGLEEIAEAEKRYLDEKFPLQRPEEKPENERENEPFLLNFTSSPAFQDGSRYGNFRFSLPLREVLQAYSSQFCEEREPILRVWETVVYKQLIMYSVVVHSPDVHDYDDCPVLGDNNEGVCAYHNGKIIWRAQAISKSHQFRLIENKNERQCSAERVNDVEYYLWDHVTLGFYIPEGRVLSFPRERLIGCLTACPNGDMPVVPGNLIGYERANAIVEEINAIG